MTITKEVVEALGITKEEVLEAISSRAVEELGEHIDVAGIERRLREAQAEAIQKKVSEAAEKILGDDLAEMIEGFRFQETQQWGEKIGPQITFPEFIRLRVDQYLKEQVNEKGEAKNRDSYNWYAKSSRVMWMLHAKVGDDIKATVNAAMVEPMNILREELDKTLLLKSKEVGAAMAAALGVKK